MKSSEISIKTRSTPASLTIQGQVTKDNCKMVYYGNYVVFQVSFNFLLFLSYFVKPSGAPIIQSITKLQAKFCRILTTRFSERRQQIRVTRELLNQTALKTVLLKKQINITRAVLEYCTGRFVTSAPWEPTLQNNLNKGIN